MRPLFKGDLVNGLAPVLLLGRLNGTRVLRRGSVLNILHHLGTALVYRAHAQRLPLQHARQVVVEISFSLRDILVLRQFLDERNQRFLDDVVGFQAGAPFLATNSPQRACSASPEISRRSVVEVTGICDICYP